MTTIGSTLPSAPAHAPTLPDPSLPLAREWHGSIAAAFELHAADAHTAIDAPQGQWSYQELANASAALAARLDPLPADAVIAIQAERNPALVHALLAVTRAGRAFVVLDPAYPTERMCRCLRLTRPAALLNTTGRPLPEPVTSALGAGVLVSEVPSRAPAASPPARLHPAPTSQPIGPNSLLYIAFTSGSTGQPKAILGEHAPVTHFFHWQMRRFGLTRTDRFSVLSGLGHDPLLRDTLLPLWLGATVCLPTEDVYVRPYALAEWLASTNVTVCHLTPTLAQMLVAGGRRTPELPRLRYFFVGGEPLTPALARLLAMAAPNATIVNCYGATETPQVIAYHVVEHDADTYPDGVAPIGTGIDGVQLLVLDPQRRQCPVGEIGEICVRTPYLAREVWNGDRDVQAAFITNPFTRDPRDRVYPTGDYGRYLPDGAVVCLGRHDSQVKVRGHRVEPSEISATLAREPSVQAHYIDVQAIAGGYTLALYYVAPDLEPMVLRTRLAQHLPAYMVPDLIQRADHFPLTPNGKIDVNKLRGGMPAGAEPASADLLQRVLDLVQRQTGSRPASADEDLFAAGLNSLQSVMLSVAVEEAFGITLAVGDLAACRTPRGLVARIDAKAAPLSETVALPAVSAAANESEPLRLLPRNERLVVAVRNRLLQLVARIAPDAVRIKCHRLRGVSIGPHSSIGYDCIVETAYPWLVRIGSRVNISMRATIIGHFRGMGTLDKRACTVEIGDDVFIGPNVTILPNVRIGRGAVISAGSVVNRDIPELTFAHGNPATPMARCGAPLSGDMEYTAFLKQLRPL